MDALIAAFAYLPFGFVIAACFLEAVCAAKKSDANEPGAVTALFGTVLTIILAITASLIIPVKSTATEADFGWPELAPNWANIFGYLSLMLAGLAYGFKLFLRKRLAALAGSGLEGKELRKAIKSLNDFQLGYWFALVAVALLVAFTALQVGYYAIGQLIAFLPLSLLGVVLCLEAVSIIKGSRSNQPAAVTVLFATVVASLVALALATLAAPNPTATQVPPLSPAWKSIPGAIAVAFIGLAYWLKIRARDRAAAAAALAAVKAGNAHYSFQQRQRIQATTHRVITFPYVLCLLLALSGLGLAHSKLFSTRAELLAGVDQLKSGVDKGVQGIREFADGGSGSATLDQYADKEGSLGALLMASSQEAGGGSTTNARRIADAADEAAAARDMAAMTSPDPAMDSMDSMDSMPAMDGGTDPEMASEPDEESPEVAMVVEDPTETTMVPASPEPASPEPTEPVATTSMIQPYDDGRFYAASVRPILTRHCYECHGSDKDKSGLRLHTAEAIRAGGNGGTVVVAGSPESSPLYASTVLSPNDPDIMPAKGDPLSKSETEILRKWILAGAHLDDGKASSSIAGASNAGSATYLVDQLAEGIPPANPAVVQALEQREVQFRGLSSNASLLKVDFSHTPGGTKFTLDDLGPIAANVYFLDLTRTAITDEDLAPIGNFPNLRKLELNLTSIGDNGLEHIAQAKDLEMLNLYGTQVSDAGLASLVPLKNLQKLYLWETRTTQDGIAKLKEAIPGIEIIAGS